MPLFQRAGSALPLADDRLQTLVDAEDPDVIDPAQSMKDYGINSLDIVEIVSHSMRALRVKIPRSELGHITNIDGLVDVLHASATK